MGLEQKIEYSWAWTKSKEKLAFVLEQQVKEMTNSFGSKEQEGKSFNLLSETRFSSAEAYLLSETRFSSADAYLEPCQTSMMELFCENT